MDKLVRDGGDVVIDLSDVTDASLSQIGWLLDTLPVPPQVCVRYVLVASSPSVWPVAVIAAQGAGVGVVGSVDAAVAAFAGRTVLPRPREFHGG